MLAQQADQGQGLLGLFRSHQVVGLEREPEIADFMLDHVRPLRDGPDWQTHANQSSIKSLRRSNRSDLA